MRRILIIGNIAAGKSTFAALLAEQLNIQLYHLDRYFWNENWQMPKKIDWELWVNEVILKDEWILDGTYQSSLSLRASHADLVIYLDAPTILCLFRYIKRSLLQSRKGKADIPVNASERITFRNIRAIYNFNSKTKPSILKTFEDSKKLLVFKSLQSAIDWTKKI